MKLSTLGNTPSKEFNFLDPYTNQPTDIYITVKPLKSKAGKEIEHNMRLKIAELMQDEKNIIKTDKRVDLNPDIMMDITISMVAELVEDWRGIQDDDDKDIVYSKEIALELLREHQSIADAIYLFSSNLGNFQK